MANIRSVWDSKKGEKSDGKKFEMFSQDGAQSGTGVLRPVKDNDDDLNSLMQKQQAQGVKASGNLDKAIIIYKNGFKIGEDGEFRSSENPQNREFIASIKKGFYMKKKFKKKRELPEELTPILREKFGDDAKSLGVNVVNRENEEFKVTVPKFVAFEGAGHTLASKSEKTVNLSDCDAKEAHVDEKSEGIRVQLILLNGKKVTQKFNNTHTVLELISGYNKPFDLLAGFPPEPLVNPHQTLKDAGLNGARVTQKAK
ncbi:UBX domain containing protein [Reticulomyxa filosa]|uniref:UBX domain containing protein n=1 Tax=Reticulomyxa filosa TaxID=46433 RepID=X6N2R2_RETFI|nr:UBX domain containing protein [Reticulomyxa filosa]|eukprot:ETO19602.1 UBX domain containing protein [Reticulomyxa filosa]